MGQVSINSTSRRSPVPSMAMPNDAKLLGLAAAYTADFSRYNFWIATVNTLEQLDADTSTRSAAGRQQEMLQDIALLPAHTAEGRRAKAKIILDFQREILCDDEIDSDRLIAASLARDILG